MGWLHGLVFVFTCLLNNNPGVLAIGINYGLNGENLPSPGDVVSLLKSRNISAQSPTRLWNISDRWDQKPGLAATCLRPVCRNELGCNQLAALFVVSRHHVHISNEVLPGDFAQYVPGAMENLDSAVRAAGLGVPVSTTVSMQILSQSYPPSSAVFTADASHAISQVVTFLQSNQSPLLLNAYPYLPRASSTAMSSWTTPFSRTMLSLLPDGEFTHRNLFDAMVDGVHAALEKARGADVQVVVTETGWPTEGSSDASIENARIYNNNLVKHVSSGQGTPRRPGKAVEAYIFALFNEDLKPDGVEQHWGLYYPDMTEVYHIDF